MAARTAIAIRIGTSGDDPPPSLDSEVWTPGWFWLPGCSAFLALGLALPPGLPWPLPPSLLPAPAPFFSDDPPSSDPPPSFEPFGWDVSDPPPLPVFEALAGFPW